MDIAYIILIVLAVLALLALSGFIAFEFTGSEEKALKRAHKACLDHVEGWKTRRIVLLYALQGSETLYLKGHWQVIEVFDDCVLLHQKRRDDADRFIELSHIEFLTAYKIWE